MIEIALTMQAWTLCGMSIPLLSPLLGLLTPPADAASILVHGKDQPVGDAFIQAGFFHALRCRYPAARITFAVSLGGCAYANTLRAAMAPFIDEVLVDQALCLKREQLRRAHPRPLADRRFDIIIDLEKKWWRTLIIRRIRHKVFVSASRHFLFSDRWPRDWSKPLHLSRQYFMLLDALRMPARQTLPLPDFRDAQAEAFAATLLPTGPSYLGIVPGAGDRSKCWPLDRFVALARHAATSGMVPVVLLGPQEKEWLAQLRAALPQALFPAWDGETMRPEFSTPLMTVALGRRLAAAVTNDCGIAHMLAAGDTPLLTLFGHTNPIKYAPLSSRSVTLWARDFGGTRIEDVPFAAVTTALEALRK